MFSRVSSSSAKTYWAMFALASAAVLVPIVAAGLYSRSSLTTLLEEGGLLESSPVILLLLACILAVIIAYRAKRILPWGAYAGLCFFLAGEEASWGEDGLLGWHFIPKDSPQPALDLHNYVSGWLGDFFTEDGVWDIPLGVANMITGSVMLAAIAFLTLAIALGFFGGGKLTSIGLFRRLRMSDLSLQFAVTGVGLIAFGNMDILQESFGLPYLPGMWPLEESYEVLGSVALLFAVVVKMKSARS